MCNLFWYLYKWASDSRIHRDPTPPTMDTPSTPVSVSSSRSRSTSSSPSTYGGEDTSFTSLDQSTAPSTVESCCSDPGSPRILTEEIIARGSDELKMLEGARMQATSEEPEDLAQHKERIAVNACARQNRYWFSKMKAVFKEIDDQTACIPRKDPFRFLDLGCCPGGFSSYILNKNPFAQGLGISSENETGGHPFLVEKRHQARFKVHYADLTYYRLGPLPASVVRGSTKSLRALPFDCNKRFDVVLLDGKQIHRDPKSNISDRFFVSELIIGLQAIKKGGTLVVRLIDPESVETAKLLHMFDLLASSLDTFKPRTMHVARSTFYAVIKGVGEGPKGGSLPHFINKLKELWVDLSLGGTEGAGRSLCHEDLDFIISIDELKATKNLDRLIKLSRAVWEVQAKALMGQPEPEKPSSFDELLARPPGIFVN
ncbi:unnamed protein product [Mycena citricolor]|uniref:Ribosomal RNA methyltransferase FtsJ domain-containing protein n=1 Tax=Mycena citricolor TaxID=2018698 RepID=A0AAD2HS16_9AGAR|nr:unnamed protein product [Mycena citricolor]